jgi:hypothetical protein
MSPARISFQFDCLPVSIDGRLLQWVNRINAHDLHFRQRLRFRIRRRGSLANCQLSAEEPLAKSCRQAYFVQSVDGVNSSIAHAGGSAGSSVKYWLNFHYKNFAALGSNRKAIPAKSSLDRFVYGAAVV